MTSASASIKPESPSRWRDSIIVVTTVKSSFANSSHSASVLTLCPICSPVSQRLVTNRSNWLAVSASGASRVRMSTSISDWGNRSPLP